MKNGELARLLAYVTGLVNQELLLQNEYLAAENHILRAQLPKRLRLTDPQIYARGNRQAARPQSAGAGRVRSETGHDPWVVPTTHRAQV